MLKTCLAYSIGLISVAAAAAAAKSLQSCPTLCDLIDGSSSGSTIPGILQARTLEWVAISTSLMHESEKWKWSRSVVSDSLWPRGLQPTRLLHPWDSPGKSTGVGCHCKSPPFTYVKQNPDYKPTDIPLRYHLYMSDLCTNVQLPLYYHQVIWN